MRFYLALLVLVPTGVFCLPFVDIIEPDKYPNHILPKYTGSGSSDPSGRADQCNWPAFQTCFSQFITNSGLNAYNTDNATYLIEAINKFLADGAQNGGMQGATNALFKLCRAQQTFYGQCLGLDQATQCMSAIEYIRQGITSNNGFSYQLTFTRLNFQCGVAFTSFIPQAMVVAQTPAGQSAALEKCVDDFINSLNDPNVNEFCGPMQVYTECVGKIYTTAASGNVDFGWTVCESYRLANIITLPGCTDSQWACRLNMLQ